MTPISYKDFAIETAMEAGRTILQARPELQELYWTRKTNFKSQIDDVADQLIRERIRTYFPEHSIMSEEQADFKTGNKLTWVVDPLDGTIPFIRQTSNHFNVSIALVLGKTPILGVIYAPERDELYVAEEGKGSSCNGEPIHVSLEDNVNKSLVGFDVGKQSKTFSRSSASKYHQRLFSANGVLHLVTYGSSTALACLNSCGKLQGYVDIGGEPWDFAAGVLLNKEAGAKVTDITGKDWQLGDDTLVCANPVLHTKLLDLLLNEEE
jgi:fructose-1,6-bisphosphatase/inositol monophosphatase family enzyme